jgi:hypothetical protein
MRRFIALLGFGSLAAAHLPQCEATNVAVTDGGFVGASKTIRKIRT